MILGDRLRRMRTVTWLMTGADREARRDGIALPARAEHALLSALALSDGSARRVLERVGADPDALRAAIGAARAAGAGAGDGAPSAFGYASASAESVLADALALSRSHRPAAFGGAHVVAAVAQLERAGVLTAALRAIGVERDALSTAAREELRSRQVRPAGRSAQRVLGRSS